MDGRIRRTHERRYQQHEQSSVSPIDVILTTLVKKRNEGKGGKLSSHLGSHTPFVDARGIHETDSEVLGRRA